MYQEKSNYIIMRETEKEEHFLLWIDEENTHFKYLAKYGALRIVM